VLIMGSNLFLDVFEDQFSDAAFHRELTHLATMSLMILFAPSLGVLGAWMSTFLWKTDEIETSTKGTWVFLFVLFNWISFSLFFLFVYTKILKRKIAADL